MGMPGDPPARQLNPQGPDHEFTMCSPVALRRPPMMLSHALHANHETVAWCTANVLATEQRSGVPTSDDVGSASFLALPLHSPRAAFPDDRDMAPVSWIGVPGWSSITASMARRSASARPIAGSFFSSQRSSRAASAALVIEVRSKLLSYPRYRRPVDLVLGHNPHLLDRRGLPFHPGGQRHHRLHVRKRFAPGRDGVGMEASDDRCKHRISGAKSPE